MTETIRAVFKGGKFEPLDEVILTEGTEVTLAVVKAPTEKDSAAFREAAGAWKDLVDCDQLIADVYASRLVHTREEPRL
jgi:predicted DNA-binding antitoxin AbrB/MazE fold protein